ncbi:zinc-binding dehydrogenase [Chloroflexota bacterium]
MLAALLVEPHKIDLRDIEKPGCGPGTMLLDMKATAICGTDLETYRHAKVALPRILGHETTGIVVDKGKDVSKFNIGDRIVVNPIVSCGMCRLCFDGKDYLCPLGGLMGRDLDGTFAEYVVVNESNAYILPDELAFTEGTQLQTLATVYHAQKRLQIEPGQSALVVGLGAAGLLHVQLAKLSGATPLVVTTRSQSKLDLAKQLGADVAIRLTDDNAAAQIREATHGNGPDIVIEAVGVPSTATFSLDVVAPGGKVLMFGIFHGTLDKDFNTNLIYYKEINLIGSRAAGKGDWQPAINLVKSGGISLKPLLTHQLPLHEIQKAFELMDNGTPELIRIALLGIDHDRINSSTQTNTEE